MKKTFKIYAWAWGIVIVSTIIAVVVMMLVPSHHDLAKDPSQIRKIVKVDLPGIAYVESIDNMDRESSRWDVYMHRVGFSKELSESNIKTMEKLCQTDSVHWQKNVELGCYSYHDEGGWDQLYSVTCQIYKDHFVMDYMVDEAEGIFVAVLLTLAYYILVGWGAVLVVILVFSRLMSRNKNNKEVKL